MTFFDKRIFHLIRKEFRQFFRDPRMIYIALIAPAVQIMLFGYTASTDIKNISTAVYDQDMTRASRAYVESISNSGYFKIKKYVSSLDELKEQLDSGQAKFALNIPRNFEAKQNNSQTADLLAIIDGSNSTVATVASGYINQITFDQTFDNLASKLATYGIKRNDLLLLNPQIRIFYNPELKSTYYMVPAILALILTIQSMLLTAFSIVKERATGTLEQLMVTPLKRWEIIFSKIIPYAIVTMVDVVIITLLTTLWFRVPLHGSFLLLFVLSGAFALSGLGLGVFISTISQNEQQSLMTALFVLIPSIILSGFVFPIANMPLPVQIITYLIPVRYYLVIVRGIFLKGIGIEYLWHQTA
ncbi:MAG: ABC transporter permease, partial [Candidatus Margulisbacteria bacterium]|nr:ABC transporter permease [Candidatus Margulisiibacteriota bacterium]